MLPEQLTQLIGHGEGHQVIVNWQQFGPLTFQPLLAFMMLAMGTAPMPAGMGQVDPVVAIVAFEEHHRTVLIAAAPHAVQCLVMAGE
jgi:hypothetical protein